MTSPSLESPFTKRSAAFLSAVESRLREQTPRQIAEGVERLIVDHDAWRCRRLNLNPAESGLSLRVQQALANDMAARLSEGLPGDKEYPHGAQNGYADELEGTVIALARRQFGADFVEWRPVSTTMANAAVFFALLQPNDPILVQSEDGGGNYSYHSRGPAGLITRSIINAPSKGEAFEIDVAALAEIADRERPRMIVVGGSHVLFPYPLAELREIADRVGALLLYDAAHLGLLISAGEFQRPLAEGAHVVTISTHKIMGGPVGGLVFTNEPHIAKRLIEVTFPGLMQTRDQNKYAALAIALTETEAFGQELATKMVENARALAAGLESKGFRIVGAERGYTQTHQIFVDLGDTAKRFETNCQAANILVSDCALVGDITRGRRSGSRLATHELTRLGLGPVEMREIARLIARAYHSETPGDVSSDVASVLSGFNRIRFSFDP